VYGKVKGVDFRAAARSRPMPWVLPVWPKNEEGDSVYRGGRGRSGFAKICRWCRKGNSWSKWKKWKPGKGRQKDIKNLR